MTLSDPTVRTGREGDYSAVMNVLDGAMLDADAGRVRAGLEGDAAGDDGDDGDAESDDVTVLVAELDGSVAGALVLDGRRVTAVAVRRSRRDRGVGTALVEAAVERRGRVTARFDARVRPFYESLGFETWPADGESGDESEDETESENREQFEGELGGEGR